jgi:opacity protein-like surface antigen
MLAAPVGAMAADLVTMPVPLAAPAWSWTGVYGGVHLGNGWANDVWSVGSGVLGAPAFTPFLGAEPGNGPVGGGQVGLNYQAGPWVVGADAALSFADVNTDTACAKALFTCSTNIDGLGTLTGRFGFAFDQFLIYGKGSAVAAHAHYQMTPVPGFGVPNVFNGSATRWGWTAGVGVEFAFNPALSAIAEYDFLDFGTRGITLTDQNGAGAGVALSQQIHLIKVGLNYKFNQGFGPWSPGPHAIAVFPTPPPASWNWTGIYIGAHAGGGWDRTNWNSATGQFGGFASSAFAGSGTGNGSLGGGQIGFNYQAGPWVMGVEADASGSDLDGYAKC